MDYLGYALFFAAWVGHSAWWLVGLNILYSRPMPRWLLKSARLSVGVLVLIFPFLLWWLEGLRLADFPPEEWTPGSAAIGIYLGLCWAMSFVGIPTVTLARQLRWRPPQLQSRSSRVVNVALGLGYKPA